MLRNGERRAAGERAAELAISLTSGSGKTFRARRLSGHVHVSKDLMPQASRRDERQLALVKDALAAGRSVVVDNVNPRIADRAPLIGAARALGAAVLGYVLDAEVKECLRRNRAREGRARVPDVAIFVNRKRLQPPAVAEGFDVLYRVRTSMASHGAPTGRQTSSLCLCGVVRAPAQRERAGGTVRGIDLRERRKQHRFISRDARSPPPTRAGRRRAGRRGRRDGDERGSKPATAPYAKKYSVVVGRAWGAMRPLCERKGLGAM